MDHCLSRSRAANSSPLRRNGQKYAKNRAKIVAKLLGSKMQLPLSDITIETLAVHAAQATRRFLAIKVCESALAAPSCSFDDVSSS
jgi:hypothetical protein